MRSGMFVFTTPRGDDMSLLFLQLVSPKKIIDSALSHVKSVVFMF